MYVTFRPNFDHFDHFDHFELDLRGHTHVRGAAFSCLRLKIGRFGADLTFLRPFSAFRLQVEEARRAREHDQHLAPRIGVPDDLAPLLHNQNAVWVRRAARARPAARPAWAAATWAAFARPAWAAVAVRTGDGD